MMKAYLVADAFESKLSAEGMDAVPGAATTLKLLNLSKKVAT